MILGIAPSGINRASFFARQTWHAVMRRENTAETLPHRVNMKKFHYESPAPLSLRENFHEFRQKKGELQR